MNQASAPGDLRAHGPRAIDWASLRRDLALVGPAGHGPGRVALDAPQGFALGRSLTPCSEALFSRTRYHAPRYRGARFSAKAASASRRSCGRKRLLVAARLDLEALRRSGSSRALVDRALSRRARPPGRWRRSRARARARSRASSPPGAMRFTSPMRSASSAPSLRAVRIRSFARALPMRRGSRCVPPAPGMIASEVSVSPSSRVRRGDAQVAGEQQLRPAAEGDAVDDADRRLRQRLDVVHQCAGCSCTNCGTRSARHRLALLQVGAGAEGLLARAGDQHRAHREVLAQLVAQARAGA